MRRGLSQDLVGVVHFNCKKDAIVASVFTQPCTLFSIEVDAQFDEILVHEVVSIAWLQWVKIDFVHLLR